MGVHVKTLLLMRHAKSDWNAAYGADHDRPLNERGQRSARVMGRVLAAENQIPQLVKTSTALRARSTSSLASEAGGWDCEIVPEPSLYGSGPDTAVEVAAASPDLERVMLVGHQPTWSVLVSMLTGDRVEMRTGTVAVIELDIDHWPDLRGADGRISASYQPRDYFESEFDRA